MRKSGIAALGCLATLVFGEYSPFTGPYSDPNHPGCPREVQYSGNNKGSIVGSDAAGGEGVPCDGQTDIPWGPLPAYIDKLCIIADFSPKGGPSDLHGKFSIDEFGILWDGGNLWSKLEHPKPSVFNGVYSDPNHPNCKREIFYVGNETGYVYGADNAVEDQPCDGSTDVPWGPLRALITKNTIVVDFSPKGGPSDLNGQYDHASYSIQWDGGNSWTKLLRPRDL